MGQFISVLKRAWAWTKWIRLAITAFVLLVLATTVPFFLAWNSERERDIAAGSQIATTSKGEIEFAIEGEGTPYLQLHGSPGGYDQTIRGRRDAAEPVKGRRTIGVSRPGYLRTPLSSGRTPEEQADLFAALLDQLKIDRVVVQGSSGGSYGAIQFALRHPERTIALVLYAPDLGYKRDKGGDVGNVVLDYATWLISTDPLISLIGPSLAKDFDPADPIERERFRTALRSTIPSGPRMPGRRNDHQQRARPEIDAWHVERINAPTLIVHGTADRNTNYQRSVDLASRIPGARLVSIKGGDHLAFVTRGEEVRSAIDGFLADVRREAR